MVEELAVMVKNGFDETGRRFEAVEGRLANLEQGQTDIKARLDSNVYRFEFHALEKRVEDLEIQVRERK